MAADVRVIDALNDARIDYDKKRYDQNKPFRDNGIDSLDVMSLLLAIEEKYGIKFSEEEADAIKMPANISSILDQKLGKQKG